MTRIPTRLLALLTAVALLAAGLTTAAHAADRGSARAGAAWLARAIKGGSNGQAADTLVALRAAGTLSQGDASRRARQLRAGAGRYANSAGATAKVILGLAAARSGSARCAGNLDLLARLRHFGHHGRYGSTIFDQTLGMLAMRTLRAGPPVSTISFLLSARGRGGWNFNATRSGGRADDVTSTAMAILAARAAGVPRGNGQLRAGLGWLLKQRAASGGFALGRRDRSEANSTALAIEAEHAMGRRDGRAQRVLRSLQRGGGAFQFTRDDAGSRIIATADAVVAMAGRALPVAVLGRTPRGC